jgi:hypothetical protein
LWPLHHVLQLFRAAGKKGITECTRARFEKIIVLRVSACIASEQNSCENEARPADRHRNAAYSDYGKRLTVLPTCVFSPKWTLKLKVRQVSFYRARTKCGRAPHRKSTVPPHLHSTYRTFKGYGKWGKKEEVAPHLSQDPAMNARGSESNVSITLMPEPGQ